MSFALKLGSNGELQQIGASDNIQTNQLDAASTAANMTIGANLDADGQVVIGNADADASVLRDLLLTRNILPGAGSSGLGTGTTQYFGSAWLQAVNDNGPDADAYNLRASGTSAGAYAVGVNASLIAQSSATDLMSALADMSSAISGAGSNQDTLAIENGVTIAAGDCVALSITTTGRCTLAIAASGGTQNGAFVGIAATGGTGDAGGTVSCTFTLPGNAEDAGAGLAAGAAVFIPVAGGAPVATAPSGAGQLVKRVGYATTATRIYIAPGVGVAL